jgi:hypothetical protein
MSWSRDCPPLVSCSAIQLSQIRKQLSRLSLGQPVSLYTVVSGNTRGNLKWLITHNVNFYKRKQNKIRFRFCSCCLLISKLRARSTRPAGRRSADSSTCAVLTLILFWVQNVAWSGVGSLYIKNKKCSLLRDKKSHGGLLSQYWQLLDTLSSKFPI